MKILDFRNDTVIVDHSRKTTDINWISGFVLALLILAAVIGFNRWLDNGCALQGVITWHGKECLQ